MGGLISRILGSRAKERLPVVLVETKVTIPEDALELVGESVLAEAKTRGEDVIVPIAPGVDVVRVEEKVIQLKERRFRINLPTINRPSLPSGKQ